jgi:hypothetical protein
LKDVRGFQKITNIANSVAKLETNASGQSVVYLGLYIKGVLISEEFENFLLMNVTFVLGVGWGRL